MNSDSRRSVSVRPRRHYSVAFWQQI